MKKGKADAAICRHYRRGQALGGRLCACGRHAQALLQGKREWIEQTTTRKVEESEVPAHIRDRLKNEETNITHEMEEELELTV